MRLILASTSPRRKEIFRLLGIPFQVIAPQFDETLTQHRAIADEVRDFALGKAQSVARNNPQSIVIGSDTMISLEAEKIGKPNDIEHARDILRGLSGNVHRIYTSVVILDGLGGAGLTVVKEVRVKMRRFTEAEINDYLARDESLDKAGAYSIQGYGRDLIEGIDGDYLAAVGLPLLPIADYLRGRGMAFTSNIDALYRDKAFLNWASFS
jgi:septum formation protein